jgi:Histidine kinase-, DNA gyrase B-, and HSP90-like ATPase
VRFLVLRILTHSELGMFHEYRRQKKEGSKQRAVNFDGDVVDRVFPAAKDSDVIEMRMKYDTDHGVKESRQWLKRQDKNWRLEGNCPTDKCYHFVDPGCLFAMELNSGVTPAYGAWAVFHMQHPVTKAILADGESSRLTSSAMIALHGDEGARTWKVLRDARPDIFSADQNGNIVTTSTKRNGDTMDSSRDKNGKKRVRLAPNPSRLVEILASVGHTMPSAVADLVDNSISADATKIAITFGRPDGGHGRWLTIADNGCGMSPDELEEAMKIGSESEYTENALGKYGFGLKGASWSQAKVFTVVTKCAGKPAHQLTWDVDDMKEWETKSELEDWEAQATSIEGHGTVVLWKKMLPPEGMPNMPGLDPHSAEIMLLERHLALVFHRFLQGRAAGRKKLVITINGTPVEPNNPIGHPLASAYDLKTIRIPTETKDGKVQVQAYLLPSEREIENFYKTEAPGAANRALELIGLHGKRNETQGLFIYRHDRLIKWGGWHQMWATNDEKTKLARVIVNFGKDLDNALKINISKQIVQLPQQLQTEIKKIAEIARRDSQKKYRKVPPPLPPVLSPKTSGVAGTGVSSGVGPRLPLPSGPAGKPSAGPVQPRIVLKTVRTDKFVWKVTNGMTGELSVQVSELDANLLALVKHIGNDACAIGHLVTFLGNLDKIDTQKTLLAKKGD